MKPYYQDDAVTLYAGDCLNVLPTLPDNSVDAVVTDPPYGLGFMGRAWDDLPPGREWAAECRRVLKPGGHLLAFGGTRTWHRLAVAIEDAGFEIRDTIAWLYGSGFPKSHDVSKAIDRANGRQFEDRYALGREIEAARVAKGVTRQQVNGWLNAVAKCEHYESDSPGFARVPTVSDFAILRDRLGVSDEFLPLVEREEAEREVLATKHRKNDRDATSIKLGRISDEFNLTAPATADAKRWQGWGTALKPCFEPVIVARKPLSGTVAANVLQWGCGAINVSGCRIGPASGSADSSISQAGGQRCPVHGLPHLREADAEATVSRSPGQARSDLQQGLPQQDDVEAAQSPIQRRGLERQSFGLSEDGDGAHVGRGSGAAPLATAAGSLRASPGNGQEDRPVIASERDGASHQRGQGRQPTREPAPDGLGRPLAGASLDRARANHAALAEPAATACTCDPKAVATPAGRWPSNVALDETAAAALDRMSGELVTNPGTYRRDKADAKQERSSWTVDPDAGHVTSAGDRGGASRFMYTAKADSGERITHNGIAHPTVKPLDLMRWLVRLVTPPAGIVLDPFAGSGTTVEAALLEDFQCIAIEREPDYLPLITQRINRRRDPITYLTTAGEDLGLFGDSST